MVQMQKIIAILKNIGTITFDGLNLFKGTNEFGDNMANSAYRITNTGKKNDIRANKYIAV